MPTERMDFNIEWDSSTNWQRRHEKVLGTTAEIPLGMLGVYWKYAWNTARSPWLMPEIFEAILKKRGVAESVWNLMGGDGRERAETQYFIVGTQVLAYSGFYFAYEHFVLRCCEAKSGRQLSQTVGYTAIKKAIEECFSTNFEQQVWSHTDVERIRRVRNDLVHNSGTPSHLTSQIAADVIIDGHLQITPNDIKEQMEILTAKIDLFVDQVYPQVVT